MNFCWLCEKYCEETFLYVTDFSFVVNKQSAEAKNIVERYKKACKSIGIDHIPNFNMHLSYCEECFNNLKLMKDIIE